jgi:hypothetical protein
VRRSIKQMNKYAHQKQIIIVQWNSFSNNTWWWRNAGETCRARIRIRKFHVALKTVFCVWISHSCTSSFSHFSWYFLLQIGSETWTWKPRCSFTIRLQLVATFYLLVLKFLGQITVRLRLLINLFGSWKSLHHISIPSELEAQWIDESVLKYT